MRAAQEDDVGLVNKLGMVIHPVDDLDTAARFYEEQLGLAVKFRDGDRFCAFDAGGTTLALAAGDERLTDGPAVSLKVDDVPKAVEQLCATGAALLRGPEEGPHEIRAVLRDPAGNAFVVYAAR